MAAKVVLRHGRKHGLLVVVRQGRQRVREGRAEVATGELLLRQGREPGAQEHAARHPVGSVPEKAPDGARGHPVIVDERADDPRLVEGRDRPRRRVGQEQKTLLVDSLSGWLDGHGDEPYPGFAPPGQPLETVDHLVVAVVGGDHPQGKVRRLVRVHRGRAGPKRGVPSSDPFYGQQAE